MLEISERKGNNFFWNREENQNKIVTLQRFLILRNYFITNMLKLLRRLLTIFMLLAAVQRER